MTDELKVKVVAHKGHIVIIPHNPAEGIGEDGGWHPTGGTKMGCVLVDTGKQLGVSQEALDLMPVVCRGRDDIGDIDWWACDAGYWAFSWWGPIYRVINPRTAIAARGFRTPAADHYTLIANEVPADVATKVEEAIATDHAWYDTPHAIE